MSAIRKGEKALPKVGKGPFLAVKAEESVMIAPMTDLDGLISIDQHAFWVDSGNSPIFPCIGDDCPGCNLDNKARYRAFLAVLTKEEGPKIFSFGIQVAQQLGEIAAELGTIRGKMLKVKRSGSGLATRYTLVAVGKEVKIGDDDAVPDLEAHIGPTTREEIIKSLKEAGILPISHDETGETPKADTGEWERV